MKIGGLERIDINPLDTHQNGKVHTNTTYYANSLLDTLIIQSCFGNKYQQTIHPCTNIDYVLKPISNKEAKKIFGITNADIQLTTLFN